MFKKIILDIIKISTAVLIFTGCGDISNTGENTVGNNFVKALEIDDKDAATNLGFVRAFGIDANATTAFGYKVYKINYKTKDEFDAEVEASGALVVPTITQAFLDAYKQAYKKDFSISLIAENHGTIFENKEAPTNEINTTASSSHVLAVLMTAKAGFAVAMPDYLGYGASNDNYHPYILKKSSAKVSIDMLRASTKFMIDNGILFNGQVYISGYSEGGYVAMAMAQEIEKNYSSDFKLKGVAPMAGPYDVSSLGKKEIKSTSNMQYPAFLAYLTNSYTKTYDDLDLSETINYPDISTYRTFFDGNLSGPAINVSLGMGDGNTTFGFQSHTPDALWKQTFIDSYTDDGKFATRLSQNNVYDWSPKTKINLIHCIDDEIIPISMAQTAYDKFVEYKADVNITKIPTATLSQQVDPGHPFVHANCGSTAYGVAVTWFDDIRQGRIK